MERTVRNLEAVFYILLDDGGNSLTWYRFSKQKLLRWCFGHGSSSQLGQCYSTRLNNKPMTMTLFDHNLYMLYDNGTFIQYKV